MDIDLSSFIDQIITRLDLIQNEQPKLDRLMEQVDRIQNILLKQEQKQCLLDKKLEIVTNFDSLLDKKLSTMAQLENLLDKKLTDISKFDSLLDKKLSNITDSDDMLDKRLSNITTADSLLDKKLSAITKVDGLLDTKFSDLIEVLRLENSTIVQEIKDAQKEIMGHMFSKQLPEDVAVGQVSTQPVQETPTEQHLQEYGDVVNETEEECGKLDQNSQTSLQLDSKHQIENESQTDTVLGVELEREEAGHISSDVNSDSDLLSCHTRMEPESVHKQINERLNFIEASFRENLQQITQEVNKNTAQSEWIVGVLKEKGIIPQETNSSISSQTENCGTVMSMVVNKQECQLSSENRQKTDEVAALLPQKDNLDKKIEQSAEDIKNYMYKIKMEIFAVIEKEAQIVRDRIERPLTCHGKYVFDFYIDNFKMLVRSEKDIHSSPWHINEMKSCMMGMIWFTTNGEMEVCFVFARHPREMGLQPSPAIKLKVKSTVCDIHKKVLPDVDIGEKVWTVKEQNITCNFDWGCKLGILSCDDLLEKGYGHKEEYRFGALMVRFHVTVCRT